MAAIDDLIAQIEDEALRDRLREEVDRLTKEKKFGLVFEEHLPEFTPIYSALIREGSRVARRDASLTGIWRVLSTDNGQALCLNPASGEQRQMPTDDLVVVRRFGEPIFPALTPVDRVQNGPDDAPWHALIEADNYHALQLLEYLYTGQVDCIYIDPPYNTGARDWKYNNDYVDANDRWRHSKWLAMIRRRLVLAFRLLKPDGIIVITIDDNEIHHLRMLLEDACFGQSLELGIICIRNNPGGRATANGFSVNHEYAVFIGKTDKARPGRMERTAEQIARYDQLDEKGPFEWSNFRKHGAGSDRSDRKRQYYPIYASLEGIRIPGMTWNAVSESWENIEPARSEESVIWPVRFEYGMRKEKVWSWGVKRVRSNLSELMAKTTIDGSVQIYKKERVPIKEGRLPITWWDNKLYSSNEYGSRLLSQIFADESVEFQYPKSPYAVVDTLKAAAIGNVRHALVLDFFAGSGTTLHAVNLLNAYDGGNRRCILVTNNEVSEDEAKSLSKQDHRPGDLEWEQHGICRSVTWPRSKYTILGRRDDGTELEGDYLTGNSVSKEKARTFRRLGYIDPEMLDTGARKQEIVSLIEGIPKTHIKADTAFFVSEDERHTAAILFEDTQGDAFLDALEEMDHITHFYVVTRSDKLFRDLKAQITDMLGPIEVQEEEKRPMREGFPTNLEYVKLDFLEKDQVALGRQFRAILPLLWLRAGAVGPRPKLTEDDSIPAMLLPAKNPFAVLVDETRFADFQAALAARDDLTHVFLITDSEEAFQEMAAQLTVPHVIQLYRDYLENFAINRGDVS
ncbi:MAG: site-specific DNA-methyltransferase [Planctomycetes bacterium]|nr:site-specific DNA-methyltransferase [Planctomycetota bacterium]